MCRFVLVMPAGVEVESRAELAALVRPRRWVLAGGEPERLRRPSGACLCGIDLEETGRAGGYEVAVPEHGMWVEWRRPE